MNECPDCGAASSGNLTCRTCRQQMRQHMQSIGISSEFLDKLDEANIATIPPLGPEAVLAFQKRLDAAAAREERRVTDLSEADAK